VDGAQQEPILYAPPPAKPGALTSVRNLNINKSFTRAIGSFLSLPGRIFSEGSFPIPIG
jgi:hypothetical protein